MYRINGIFKGQEYVMLTDSLHTAIKIVKRSRKTANLITVRNEKGIALIRYIKGLKLAYNLA